MSERSFSFITACSYGYFVIKMKKIYKILLCLLGVVVLSLVAATIVEKYKGHDFASKSIYESSWLIILWILLAIVSLVFLIRNRLWRRKCALGIHLSFILILCGAFLTHLFSQKGMVCLQRGETSNIMILSDNSTLALPFNLRLDSFVVKYYGGTDTPQDYMSTISFVDNSHTTFESKKISMNNVASYDGYRFFQTSYSPDMQQSVLSVSYDPIGMTVTYVGYVCLFFSMLLFLFQKKSMFRMSLRKLRGFSFLALLIIPSILSADNLKSASKDVADEFGKSLVLYQGRICPVNTLALDFCRKLYKTSSYKGYNANEVLCGWLFYPMEWREDISLDSNSPKDKQKILLIESLYNGNLLKMYPIVTDKNATLQWVGRSNPLPESISVGEWTFIRKVQSYLQQLVMTHDDSQAIELIKKVKQYQCKKAGNAVPSDNRQNLEILYNNLTHTKMVALSCMLFGFCCFVCSIICLVRNRKKLLWLKVVEMIAMIVVFSYLLILFCLRWIVMGAIPLSNGYEAMEFMALLISFVVLLATRYFPLVLSAGLLVVGFSLLVALFGESDPPITPLMPVLASPLLSVHVMTIMLAYALMAIMFIVSMAVILINSHSKNSLVFRKQDVSLQCDESGRECSVAIERLTLLNSLLLTPTVFLLAFGIFIGAVWANVSWGSYWQWDPKETWALITLLVYCLPLHRFVGLNKSPLRFNVYLAIAFVSVLITYFGVNFFLGGMHSYA